MKLHASFKVIECSVFARECGNFLSIVLVACFCSRTEYRHVVPIVKQGYMSSFLCLEVVAGPVADLSTNSVPVCHGLHQKRAKT
jgi:hypothetical protein